MIETMIFILKVLGLLVLILMAFSAVLFMLLIRSVLKESMKGDKDGDIQRDGEYDQGNHGEHHE